MITSTFAFARLRHPGTGLCSSIENDTSESWRNAGWLVPVQYALAHQTAAQTWTEGAHLSFTLPSNTFADPNGEALSYTATLSNGQALPSWLTLNGVSSAFSGTIPYTSGSGPAR
jgi:hypothetical protein